MVMQGLGVRVYGLGFGDKGSGFTDWGFRVADWGVWEKGLGFALSLIALNFRTLGVDVCKSIDKALDPKFERELDLFQVELMVGHSIKSRHVKT